MHIHYYTFGAAQELYRTQWWGLKRVQCSLYGSVCGSRCRCRCRGM